MHSPSKNTSRFQEGSFIDTVEIDGREGKELPIGSYEKGIPQPRFDIEIAPLPCPNDIKARLIRINREGEYQLSYYFQNFADRKFTITVREKDA